LFGLKDGGIVKIDIDPADADKLKFAYNQVARPAGFVRKPERPERPLPQHKTALHPPLLCAQLCELHVKERVDGGDWFRW
jgi:hypothetical protein